MKKWAKYKKTMKFSKTMGIRIGKQKNELTNSHIYILSLN